MVVRLTAPALWLLAWLRQQQQAPMRVPEPGGPGQAWVGAKLVRRAARFKVPVEVAPRALDKEAIPHPCGPACLHA